MKDLKGTKTEKNLMEAFAGESMARNKYTYFASKAKKDGFVQIAKIFEETANNEKEHAKIWFKYLNGGSVSDTAANLLAAAEGENQGFVLMHSTGSLAHGSEIDVPLNYADYYYLEGLQRYMNLKGIEYKNL